MRLPDFDLGTLLTEHGYANIIKRSVASVRRDRLLKQGCPYVKLGALVRYRPEDVKAHIVAKSTTSLSGQGTERRCGVSSVSIRVSWGGPLNDADYAQLERS
jgi:hypothetical protein